MTLTFNWGKDSIGWAVFKTQERLNLLGAGTVTFSPNSAIAVERRNHRRQRRHIRSTRQRIVGLRRLLSALGVLTDEELNRPGCAWPWLLASRALRQEKELTWFELWDVLRWYAHNRGYDGNRRWSYLEDKVYFEQSQKERNALALMEKYGTSTMAETLCAELGLSSQGLKKASQKRFKGLNAAFPRQIVEDEVQRILSLHLNRLPKLDETLIRTLLGRDIQDKEAWKAIPCSTINLPRRFEGGLLFGQLIARYDNRDLSICPITYAKILLEKKQLFQDIEMAKRHAEIEARTPSIVNCPEFYRYRWGKLLSKVEVRDLTTSSLRFLTQDEREKLTLKIEKYGYLTPTQFKKAVREVAQAFFDNTDTLLQSEKGKEALLLNPIRKLETSNKLAPFWNVLPERLQKRFRGKLQRGSAITLEQIRTDLVSLNGNVSVLDQVIDEHFKLSQARKRKSQPISKTDFMRIKFYPESLSGRAPYSRDLLAQAATEFLTGKDPYQPGGCLSLEETMRREQIDMPVSRQTKSHWVRHRMLALERLVKDLTFVYASDDLSQIKKIIFKVDHLSSWSMKFDVPQEKSETERVLERDRIAKKLQLDKKLKSFQAPITAELLQKACIAEDLGWRCPYTGEKYQPIDIVLKRVDKDYIEPDLKTFSNSLDSLVLTFAEIHQWKGKRSALRFVEEETGKPVPNRPNLSITSPSHFRRVVENLEIVNEEAENRELNFPSSSWHEIPAREIAAPFSLTQIGSRVIERVFKKLPCLPEVVTLSKTILGLAQQKWNLEKYLYEVCPQLKDQEKQIAHATYLSRAAKACLQGFTSYYLNQFNSGKLLETGGRISGNLHSKEENFFTSELPLYLKQQVKNALERKCVVQFLPSRMRGLKVEQNMWRVVSLEPDQVTIQQRIRNESNLRLCKTERLQPVKLLGLYPEKDKGKLKKLKSTLIMRDNFGVTTSSDPEVVPFHKVWKRLKNLKQEHGKVSLLRNGQLLVVPKERHRKVNRWELKGTWRIFSIKNNRGGVALDLGYPDAIRAHMINISLSSLLKAGAYPLKGNLAGKKSEMVNSNFFQENLVKK